MYDDSHDELKINHIEYDINQTIPIENTIIYNIINPHYTTDLYRYINNIMIFNSNIVTNEQCERIQNYLTSFR
jgi:hypothetical protein